MLFKVCPHHCCIFSSGARGWEEKYGKQSGKNNLLFFVEIDLSIFKVWRMLELAQIRKFINYCSNIATCYSSVKHETPCCCYWLVRIIYVAHFNEQITTTTNPCLLSPAELNPRGYYYEWC